MILLLIGILATVIPMWKLIERAGYNPMWSLACVSGIGLIVLLWVLAFKPRSAGFQGDGDGR